ncbi:MAG TPA: hypothetical protein EYG80_00160, partial [Flavobacteriaceae bacterium]|nr:hypothetical protein [Flavobacteriaceae bacterium]
MKSLHIKNFKCFEDEEINFSNLTVLAGNNGSGKSTVIQALLIMAQSFDRKDFIHIPKRLYINDYYCELGNAQRLRNYNASKDSIEFIFKDSSGNEVNFICSVDKQDLNILNIDNYENVDAKLRDQANKSLDFLAFFDFISADRFGPKTFHHTDSNFSRIKVGKYGEYSTLVLNKYRGKVLNINLPTKEDGKSLLSHVNFWLSKIFGHIQIDTEFIKEANVAMLKIKNNPHGEYESPVNMPYGVSYVLPIIVSCLVRNIPKEELFEDSKKEDIQEFDKEMIIIENPEAHLHPSAQSMLGIFLAIMSKKIQIVIETHSEHIINGIR